jgi:hypothetical protein
MRRAMHGSSDHCFRMFKFALLRGACVIAPVALAAIPAAPNAEATPTFARQTGKTCSFCHSGPPRLNDTGVTFKNSGFVLPGGNAAPDRDPEDAPHQ